MGCNLQSVYPHLCCSLYDNGSPLYLDVSPVLKSAEHKFDLYMKRRIGVNPSLMMPGNYARTIFDVQNEEALQ